MGIKTTFGIKDLENLSGVKAHTIRIWEKRYKFFEPFRTDTNLRLYSLHDLQKILTINILLSNGMKLSKIAQLNNNEIFEKVRELREDPHESDAHYDQLKLSMIQFDQKLFNDTFNFLRDHHSLYDVFYNYIIPLFEEIGNLWVTQTITPAHENFVSTLVRQKLLCETEKAYENIDYALGREVIVCFLPKDEIHELGLMYVHYELLRKGYHSIYLGQSVPIENLVEICKVFANVHFVSYFTVQPIQDEVKDYMKDLIEEVLEPYKSNISILGRMVEFIDCEVLPERVSTFSRATDFVEAM